ncbi:MAG: D-sedoheptulose-7-phosphate isomerase [Chitinophagaceae bacterium]
MEKFIELAKKKLLESIEIKQLILRDEALLKNIQLVAEKIVEIFKKNGKVFFCGNGGSAADAQHISAEFTGRFYKDRQPLFAEALHVNTSFLTAVANDYSYDEVYSRLAQAKMDMHSILVGLSTSGNSKNIIKAFEYCQTQRFLTVGFTGATGGKMKDCSDILLNVPSTDTPRIQEAHITIAHIICEFVENELF